ncbi:MAG TPA: SMP-30/gluconolactonase/LRE family protein [Micromonosporaceae bacterium]|jgi:sugar lactone lactonase YvrE|nr:SMP-30/gluconolactonase/LRE family protein [Micromonosporaceae bacterium]
MAHPETPESPIASPPTPRRVPRPKAPRVIAPARADATEPPGFDGVWAPDDRRLDDPVVLRLPTGSAPEDVVVDLDGRLVAGGEDGAIWRWPASASRDAATPDLVATTGGRPLGIEVDPRDGTLIVCDAYRGLLRIGHDGAIHDLAAQVAGTPILFCNNAAVAADGVVYFSDSSTRYPLSAWKRDLLEHRPNGRLLRYDPADGSVDVVVDGLYFPNGVALTPDEQTVMLVETTTHRLLRIPLAGGGAEVLTDLAAYPDNMSAVGDGTYWIALPSPRLPAAEKLLPHPGVRRVVALLPDKVQPRPGRYGLVAFVDGDGTVLRTMHGPAGRYTMITGVRQHGDTLWLGSLSESGVARIAL